MSEVPLYLTTLPKMMGSEVEIKFIQKMLARAAADTGHSN